MTNQLAVARSFLESFSESDSLLSTDLRLREDIPVPGTGRSEFTKVPMLGFFPSVECSECDKIRLSCDRPHTSRPLFHPGKVNDDDTLSLRNESAALATGNSFVVAFSTSPRLDKGKRAITCL